MGIICPTSESNQEEHDLRCHLHTEGNEDQVDPNAVVVVARVLVALGLPWHIRDAGQGNEGCTVDADGDEQVEGEHVCACVPLTATGDNSL